MLDRGCKSKSKSNQKSGARMFRASMGVMGAAKVVRVHAKIASKPKDWGGRNQTLSVDTSREIWLLVDQ